MLVQEMPLLLHTVSSEKQHVVSSAVGGMLFSENAFDLCIFR